MKQCYLILLLLNINLNAGYSQINYSGSYTGIINQDPLKLELQETELTIYTGNMQDSQQKYIITASVVDGKLVGNAIEQNLGINFILNASFHSGKLKLELRLDVPGNIETMEVILDKKERAINTDEKSNEKKNSFQFPKEANHNPQLIGIWAKEQIYNSGTGSDYMGTTHKEILILFENGNVGDGGSQTTISGSNFLGQSQSEYKALPNVFWYNIGNQLYFTSLENGKSETVHLGKYYIENAAMLITSKNGEKSLLKKVE
ncbi:MAG: hypothetical protein IPO16_13815 [Saprospiraceae bacterium]|nr:hypothetical protein [Saprospiraceae bacterium]